MLSRDPWFTFKHNNITTDQLHEHEPHKHEIHEIDQHIQWFEYRNKKIMIWIQKKENNNFNTKIRKNWIE